MLLGRAGKFFIKDHKSLTLAVLYCPVLPQGMIVSVFWKALPTLSLNKLLADQAMESGET